MAIEELTRESILHAIGEYDRLGRSRFLNKYAYGKSDEYILVHNSRYYDSKAIVGVAHLAITGVRLSQNQLRGGLRGAKRHLEDLDFTVLSQRHGSLTLSWDPIKFPWPEKERTLVQQVVLAGLARPGIWPNSHSHTVHPGDRIFLFLCGREDHGLIASGHVSDEPCHDHNASDDKGRPQLISIAWDMLLSPSEKLPLDVIQQGVPGFSGRSLGGRLDGLQTLTLDAMWQNHADGALLHQVGTDQRDSDIKSSYSYGTMKRRNHQRKFKNLLLRAYEPECAVCGFDQIEILEAAHLKADSKGGPSSIQNGRLLCPNHHRAHDANLFHFQDGKPVWHRRESEFLAPVRPN